MSHRGDKRILVAPEELVIDSPDIGKVYIESLRLTNTLSTPVDLSFKLPNNPDRVYEIIPQTLRIPSNEEAKVEIRFKVLKPISKIKTIRDVINIKAEYFEQQFVITYKAGRDRPSSAAGGKEKRKTEDLEAEIRDLKANLDSKADDLQQAESKISGLEQDIDALHSELLAKKEDSDEIIRLREENQELLEKLEDSAQLHDYFTQVKAMLSERMPNFDELIDLSLRQERQKHERMSTKALELLKDKDRTIEELRERIEEQQTGMNTLQQKLTDSRVLISNTEKSLKMTNKTIEELKMSLYEREKRVQELEIEAENLRGMANRSETDDFEKHEIAVNSDARISELQSLIDRLESDLKQKSASFDALKPALDRAESEVKALREKEQYVLELSSRQTKLQHENEKTLREKEKVINELTTKVTTQTEHIQSLLSQFSQQRDSDVVTRVMKLEEENRMLQLQLAESRSSSQQPSSRSMKEEDLRHSGPNNKRVQSLEEENVKLAKSIRDSQMEFSKIRQELEESLAGKNRELLDMQQKLIHFQEKIAEMKSPDRQAKTLTPEQSQAISEELSQLRHTVQVYEQKNAELNSENELLAKRADMDHPGDNLVIQTQLVSRLNARVSSLKAREERALEALEKAEQAIREREQVMREKILTLENEKSQWNQERMSLLSSSKSPTKSEAMNAVVQTERDVWERGRGEEDTMEQVWTNAMVARYEKRIAEIDKDATGYQMKHYAALKETHDLKEKLARRISEDIENQTKWERDNVQLQVKCESMREQIEGLNARLNGQSEELAQEKARVVSLRSEIDAIKQDSIKAAASREAEILKLSSQRESLQSELKERTAQISILMETLVAVQDSEVSDPVAKKCADLAVQLSNEQAVISNLELRIADLKAVLQGKMREIADVDREKSAAVLKSSELEAKNASLTQSADHLSKQILELRQESVAQTHDNQSLQAQIRRLQDDLSDAKSKLSTMANQLTESERRNSQVLAKERREFKEALLTSKDAPLQMYDVSQPVVLALKQLTVALNAISDKAPSPDLFLQLVKDMGELVVNCDKALIMTEAKVRRLEFVTQSEVYFKYLDPATIEMTYSMLDKQEMLANELKRLKKPQQTNMQEVYRRRIEELENIVKARNESLRIVEMEKAQNQHFAASLKERIQMLEGKLNSLTADRTAFEVLSLARAEEELKGKNRLRDESVKTYIDGVITRAALNSSEASKLLSLSREIASLKLTNDDLVGDLSTRSKERDMLYLANESLKATIDDLEQPKADQYSPEESPNVELRTKCDQQSSRIFDLKREIETYKEKIDELEQHLASSQPDEKHREDAPIGISLKEEELKNELLEMKEQHRMEVDSLRTDCNLKMQTFKKELETEYSRALEQFQDGVFPGEFKRRSEELERQLKDLAGEHAAMEDMLVQAKATNSALQQANMQLREEFDLARSILSDLQNPLIAQNMGSEAPPSPRRGSVSSKKPSKKQLSLDRPGDRSIPIPQKLVKALISAKISEAEAIKKLRTAGKLHTDIRETSMKKDARIRDLEAKVKTFEAIIKRKGVDVSSASSVDDQNEALVTFKSRLAELEQENDELRLAEASNWANYAALTLSPEDDMSVSEVPRDDFALLVEGIVYLTQHLDQEQSLAPATVEQSQRLVIRALGRTIAKLSKEPISELIEYRPSKAEDRQVWYLELVETQLNEVHETIRKLVEFTNKVSVEITGSFAGSAQYKGASLELAKCTKETADELETMHQLCVLVKKDLETHRSGPSPRDSDEFAYRDRATLAENMKRRLEEEIVNIKMEHAYAVAQLESQIADLNDSKKRTSAQLDIAEGERARAGNMLEETKARVIQAEIEVEKERETNAHLKAKMADIAAVKQDAGNKVDKFQRELRQWQSEHMEKLRVKEDTIAELQKQVKAGSEERQKLEQVVSKLKAKTVKRGDAEDEDQMDLKRKVAILTEEKKMDEAKQVKEREALEARNAQLESLLKDFRSQLQSKDSELESLKKVSKSASRPPRQKDISKEADLELEIHSQAIEIMNMKNEHESELIRLQTLLADTQKQLREKVENTDSEVRKRLESEGKCRELMEERRAVEDRLRQIAETSTVEAKNWQDELDRAEKEIKRLRTEREDLISSLQEKKAGADNLAQLILQTEKERKAAESDLRSDKERLSEALSFEKAQQTALCAEIRSLKGKLETMETDIRASQGREADMQDMLEAKERSVNDLRKEILSFAEKQKTWEDTFESMKQAKEDSERNLGEQIKDLKGEMARQFENYEKNIGMYDGQLNALKDICAEEQRSKRGVKKGAETVDYFLQLSKKEADLKALKAELREIKRKPSKKTADDDSDQPQVYKLKTKIHALKAQLSQERDNSTRLQDLLEKYDSTHEEAKEKESTFRKEVTDIERKYKAETQRLAEEVTRIREKWHSPEEWSNLLANFKDLEGLHKRTLEELKRKSEVLETMKSAKEQHDSEANALQDELENIKDIAETVKKLKNEVLRKDRAITDMKTALEQMRETDKRIGEENAVLSERLKNAQTDIKRKETMLKEWKARMDAVSGDIESGKTAGEQCEKLKDQVKRLKQDVERKDASAKLLKTKLESAEQEVETLKSHMHQTSTDAFSSLESEINKNKVLDANLKRSEAQLQALYLITKRIFRELVKSVESLKLRVQETEGFDKEMYSDCMDILRLSEDELREFVGQGRDSTSGVLEQIDRLLEEKAVNVNEIIELFEKLLEERAQLERSSSEVASKYQDYIRRMQQEVSQEREAYEQKIKDLEASIKRKRKN